MPRHHQHLLLTFCIVSTILALSWAEGEASYQARCEVGVTSTNETLDTCDSSRFLKCQDGRCLCQDQGNLIWSSMATKPAKVQIILSRTKRAKGGSKGKGKGGSKGGGSKGGGGAGGIATAAVAGGAGGFLAGSVVSGLGPSIGSIVSRRTTTESSVMRSRRYHSCYSRVGAECVLDNFSVNGDVIINIKNDTSSTEAPQISSSTTTTTTVATVAAATATVASSEIPENSTTTSEPPPKNETESTTTSGASSTLATIVNETVSTTPAVVSGTTEAMVTASSNILRIPKCVEFAVCASPPVKIVNGTVVSGDPTGRDPRLGVCQCGPGYRVNSQDICVKI